MNPQPTNPDEFWWADPALKERLLRDPVGALRERGFNAPPGLPLPVVHELVRITWLLWLGGRLVPLERFHIEPSDEGLLFGRGVWESTRTIAGVPWLWPEHLDRLRRTAALLEIDLAPHRLPNDHQVTEYVRALTPTQDVVVRLNLTAGPPGRPGVMWMSASLPPAPLAGVRLQSRCTAVREDQPHLSWKTFHYAYRLRTGQQAAREGFDTALMLDTAGNVLEASHANIFLRFDDGWATPSAAGGLLLPGTVRAHLLRHSPIPVRECVVPGARLSEVREAFVTNSNVGIVPVVQIDDRHFTVGPGTTELMNWLHGPKRPGG
jgi:branched-subunit amino acid aminotransferase/4-amino-4-deoxychorismate lyase